MSYKDVVILLRTVKEWMNIYYEILLKENIPTYIDAGEGYFETVEVGIFLNLISLIDNKKQDIPLLSVLRSPIGGFSTDEIIQIRLFSKDTKYHQAFEKYAEMGDSNFLAQKCRTFLDMINYWRIKGGYLPVDEFLWCLLHETGYYTYVSALPGGHQRQANLRVLIDKSKQFKNSTMKGLFDFLKFMEQIKRTGSGINTAKVINENDDVVKIMSIHKSKGLEFPIVIVGGLGKMFNHSNQTSRIAMHKDLGIGMRNVNPNLGVYLTTINQKIIKHQKYKESIAEEMRILYVAFTRAQDRLVLVGTVPNLNKSSEKWLLKDENNMFDANCYLDWICPILFRHQGCKRMIEEKFGCRILDVQCMDDTSRWKIERIDKKDIQYEIVKQNQKRDEISKGFTNGFDIVSENDSSIVIGRLDWAYPYKISAKLPSKLSVTEIRKLMNNEIKYEETDIPVLEAKPKFIEEASGFSAMERGTIMHLVMQHIDVKRTSSIEELIEQIKNMIEAEILTKEEAETINIQKIIHFFESSIGKRMKKAERLYREIPFNIIKPARDVIPDIEHVEEELMVQGTIDCYFKEKEKHILLDYKNDYLSLDMINEKVLQTIIDKYRIQLDLYKEALERIKGIKIDEVYLYLFSIEKAILIKSYNH